MKQGQGFLLVFSITSNSSLNELSELREQIVRIKDDENVPIVIVGNKSDLEEDRVVPRARAFALSQSWGNAPYYETSARRRANVNEVFIDLCRQIIRKDAQGGSMGDWDIIPRKREGQSRQERRQRRRPTKRKGPCVILVVTDTAAFSTWSQLYADSGILDLRRQHVLAPERCAPWYPCHGSSEYYPDAELGGGAW
ncbi:putative RAS small monomeric GTPase (Rsr1) [Aspergillus lucknowensis]|uniref:P-loop containing nucleoside triphosphate hydrolase protein n=1 Tax=Aspergillus lucknowensis TaxID=176173 RepID=A0ABR4LVG8_9EURO